MEVKSMGSTHQLLSKLFFLSSAEVGGIPGVAVELSLIHILGGQNMIVAYTKADVIEYMGVITEFSTVRSNAFREAALSRSPRCWLMTATPFFSQQTVFFNPEPSARTSGCLLYTSRCV